MKKAPFQDLMIVVVLRVFLAEPVVAAYAPIGPDWNLFTSCESTLDCIL